MSKEREFLQKNF